jgi:ferredoxin
MPKKYHINPKSAPLELDYLFKFKIVRGENCINCGKCSKVCIYEAHKRQADDPRKMAEPNTVLCRNCFRCIQECPRGALEKSLSAEYCTTGGSYWKPDMLITLWKQAETGAVPVSGAGYRGPFTGTGFDSMWTDMSEIVRPTRDGIHGREYISTGVELGSKLNHLAFDAKGQLLSKTPHTVAISIPIIFDVAAEYLNPQIKEALLKAAAEIDTCVILPPAQITPEVGKYSFNVIPVISAADIDKNEAFIKKARLVAIEYSDEVLKDFPRIKERIKKVSSAITIIRIPAVKDIENIVMKLTQNGAEVIQLMTDYRGRELTGAAGAEKRLLKDIIRSVHLKLVENRIRDGITIIASGGIAMAEQVPKAMLCGADLVAVDIPLLIALGTRVYEEPQKLVIPEGLARIPLQVVTQRIVNLMGAWHSQILEMMGAMGIREARRLRGESGRAIFFEEIDKDTFQNLFKKRKEVKA